MASPPDLAAALHAGYAHALDLPFLTLPDGSSLTYAATERRADGFAGALRSAGVGSGDRVLVKTTKSPAAVALYLACIRMGAVYIPLNPAFTDSERQFFIDDAEPAAVIIDPDDEPAPSTLTLTLAADGSGTLAEAASRAAPIDAPVASRPDDIAAMLYTSGTTGRPKGAMLSHRALIANGTALHRIWGFQRDDVLLHVLPIFHTHGLFVALHCAMLSGAEVRFLPRFTVEDTLASLPGTSVMMAVPTIFTRLLDDPRFGDRACGTVRLFTSGSAPMTELTHERFFERTGHRILERYGMTEAGIITSNPLEGRRVPGTVGFALPGYDVRVTTNGLPCDLGSAGVVEISGPHLFSGYWRLAQRDRTDITDDGYFVTGDIGALDAEGRLSLQGRSSDMIISGGENVYPREIERCLDDCPGIVESAVVGVPDPTFGEAVTAYLVVDEDAYDAAVVDARVGASLARFKHPKRYVVVDELPRNAMGKVQKNQLRRKS